MTFGPLSEWEDEKGQPKRFTEHAPGHEGAEWFEPKKVEPAKTTSDIVYSPVGQAAE